MLTPIRLTGSSLAVREIDDETTRIAPFDVRVLITGESGVGKQTIARLIHERSRRATRPFVTIDCGAVADSTFESEWLAPLTDAGGTLFLRGAEQMSAHQQRALHRYLESAYEAHGAVRPRLRVLAGSRIGLFEAVEAGTFRRDLFYRLNTVHICVPPLRERIEDVPVLFDHFVREIADTQHCAAPYVAAETEQALLAYSWPDNVRELKQVAKRLVMKGGDQRADGRMPAGHVRFGSIGVKRPVHALPPDGPVIGTPRLRPVAPPRTTS